MTSDYRRFVAELFAALGSIRFRCVFSFDGLYCDKVMFGLVADERIFLKTDQESRKAFVKEGSSRLHYRTRDGTEIGMSYYELPARLYDEPDEAARWARRANEVALNSPTATRKRRKRMKQTGARQRARRRKHA